MIKKIVGFFVFMLLVATIIPITTATETEPERDTLEFTNVKIFVRGIPDTISIIGSTCILIDLISPILLNARVNLEFRMKFSPEIPKVFVNWERQTIGSPVNVTLENFTGYGTPLLRPLTLTLSMMWGMIYLQASLIPTCLRQYWHF